MSRVQHLRLLKFLLTFGAQVTGRVSLSGILCAGHSMTTRSMYANQQEDDEGGHGRSGGDAVDPQGTH
jgi:hypothetical protein